MNLLLNQVKNALSDIAKRFGLRAARVDAQANKRGEMVIAIVVPKKDVPKEP